MRRRHWFVRFEFKPQDCWLGFYWNNHKENPIWERERFDLWVCFVPMFPLHLGRRW
jgi:hypothetical protein